MTARRAAISDKASKDAELLARVVEFAEARMPRSGERQLLSDLLRAGPAVPFGDIGRRTRGWPVNRREVFRFHLVEFLRTLVATRAGGIMPEVKIRTILTMAPTAPGGHVILTVDGSANDVLWWQTISLLQRVGLERVSACNAPAPHNATAPCGRLYVQFRRRTYCSAACQNRVNVRIYRDPANAKRRQRAAARARAKGER